MRMKQYTAAMSMLTLWGFEFHSGKIHDVQSSCLHGWGLAAGSDISSGMYHFDCNNYFTKNNHKPLDQLLDQRHFLTKFLGDPVFLIKGMLHKSSLWVLFFQEYASPTKMVKSCLPLPGTISTRKTCIFWEQKKQRFPLFFQLPKLGPRCHLHHDDWPRTNIAG